ncbi:DNA sulfur modification protein DndB [Vibrio furnissii]|uniref:DNA sulfur modification protein DndB n=1 Tax=Vibrio furnissii TaxID=29494 RepID=UPI001EEABC2B|nr:DNA sulfur modification protein DndB [Vibrio furnissii]MCG6268443.1 DNA sulfur modification protein DndB [Vibrio furnissii]
MKKELLSLDSPYTYSFPVTVGFQYKTYYQAVIPANIFVKMLRIDNQGSTLERSQRELNKKRVSEISQYLLDNVAKKTFYIIPSVIGVINTPVNIADPRFFSAFDVLNVEASYSNGTSDMNVIGRLVVHMDSTINHL